MTHEVISQVLLGKIDRQLGESRIECNLVASRQISCGCGCILDQHKIAVVTVKTPIRRVVQGFCLTCWDIERERVLAAARDTETPCKVETWCGVEFSQGDVD